MAWLARLDAAARRWPPPAQWLYVSLKWYLVAAGVVLSVALAAREYREGRVGLGTGIVTVMALATIKGVALSRRRHLR